MDELEKKELETEDSACESKEENAPADELVKELEEIRDMFQEAIDNAGAEQTQDEIIQELEEFVEEEGTGEEVQERPLCECCEKNPSSAAYGEDYPYCEDCRELMKHYPLRIGGVISVLLVIAIFAVSLFGLADNADKTIKVLDATVSYAQGKPLTTLDTLYSYLSAESEDSAKVKKLIVESLCRAGYVADAKEYIENIFTKDQLESPFNKKYKTILERVDGFQKTQEATSDLVYDAFTGADFDYDEMVAKLDEVKESYIDEEKGIKYEAAIIELYKVDLMNIKGIGYDEQLEVLRAIEAGDEDGFYGWIYNPAFCSLAAKMGDKELMDKYFAKAKEYNAESSEIYRSYADYFRFLETPDADEMIRVAEEAAKNARQGDVSHYRILAMAYLIKGEGNLALETMREYVNSSRISVADCNLYALCGLYCGNTEIYEEMKEKLEYSGYEISELVENYKDGKMTIKEVIADKGGDL